MVVAAVLAGGSGTRMGTSVPKQFLETGGIPVIIRSIKAFLNVSAVDCCIVSTSEEYIDFTEKLIAQHINTDKAIFVIKGGKTRSDTLLNVLNFMKNRGILEGSTVLTHDAVRPFINDRIILENIEAAQKYGACNTCIPAVDTMLISNDGEFISSVPQEDFNLLTDGCSVFTYHSEKVYMVRGENYNIKITFPEDLIRAEGIIKEFFN